MSISINSGIEVLMHLIFFIVFQIIMWISYFIGYLF